MASACSLVNEYVLHQDIDKFSKWVFKLEDSSCGTGFFCKEIESGEVYCATACHVLVPTESCKNCDIQRNNIIDLLKNNNNIKLLINPLITNNSTKSTSPHRPIPLKLNKIIKRNKAGNIEETEIITENDVALFPINKIYDYNKVYIDFSQTDLFLNLRLGAIPGPALVIQFPGYGNCEVWEQSPTGKFELGFDMGSITKLTNKELEFGMGNITKLKNKGRSEFVHNASTLKGSSGSPIIQCLKDGAFVVGVHTGICPENSRNRFTALSEIIALKQITEGFNEMNLSNTTTEPLLNNISESLLNNVEKLEFSSNSPITANEEHRQPLEQIDISSPFQINNSTVNVTPSKGQKESSLSANDNPDENVTIQEDEPFALPRSNARQVNEGYRLDPGGYSPIFSYNLYLQIVRSFVSLEDASRNNIGTGLVAIFDGDLRLIIPASISVSDFEKSFVCIGNNKPIKGTLLIPDPKPIILFDYIQIIPINQAQILSYGITGVKIAPHLPCMKGAIMFGSVNNKFAFQVVHIKKIDYDKQIDFTLSSNPTVFGELSLIENPTGLSWPCSSFSFLFQVHGTSIIELVGVVNKNDDDQELTFNYFGAYLPTKQVNGPIPKSVTSSLSSVCFLQTSREDFGCFGVLCKIYSENSLIIGILATCDSNILPEKKEDGSEIEPLGCIKAPKREYKLIFKDDLDLDLKINIDGNDDQWIVYDIKQNIFFITLKINPQSDDPMFNQLFELSRPILDRKQIKNLQDQDQLILNYIVPSSEQNENKLVLGTHYYKIVSSTPYSVNLVGGSALFHLDEPPTLERASWLMDIEGNLVGIFTGRFSENKTRNEESHWCTFISNNIDKDILTLLQNKANK